MTREEHIENLKVIASDMPSDKCSDWIESLMAGVKALEQEPCGDAVSRQSVIDAIDKWVKSMHVLIALPTNEATPLFESVHKLPPAIPQPKNEDIAKAFQLGLAFGFGEKHDEMDKVIDEIKKVITPEQEPCSNAISRQALQTELEKCGVVDVRDENDNLIGYYNADTVDSIVRNLPPVTPQSKMGHCKDCKYFEYDSVAEVHGIPLIIAHEICSRWSDGCKTKEDGYCFLFEPKESEVEE